MADSTAQADEMTLAWFVKAVGDEALAYVAACELEAEELVAYLVRAAPAVPGSVRARAVLETGADLYSRRMARNGLVQFGTADQETVLRINRDPLTQARAILRPWLPWGIA